MMTITLHRNSPGVTLSYYSPQNAEEQHTFELRRSRTQGGTYSVYKSGTVTPEVGLPDGSQATGAASGAAVSGASVSGWVTYSFSDIDRGWWYKGYGGRTGRSREWKYSSAVHINTPPTIAGPSSPSYAENRTDAVATYTATDQDQDPVTLSLGGDDAAQFSINGNGDLTFRNKPNFEDPPDGGRNNVHGVVYDLIVQANDGKDTTSKSITVTLTDVNEPPGKPAIPTVTAGSQTSLLVTWSTPTVNTGPTINDYDVRYRVSGSGSFTDTGYDGTGTTMTIDSLTADTEYHVQVLAKNDEGNSPWSESGKGKTSPLPKLSTPTNLDVLPLRKRKAMLRWDAVANASGYDVEIQALGGNWGAPLHPTYKETHTVPATSSLNLTRDCLPPRSCYEIVLDNILTGKGLADAPYAYQFRVMATNSSSYQGSDYSEEITIIDTSIYRVDGHNNSGTSANGGQAVIKWYSLVFLPAKMGSYKIRYRKAKDLAGLYKHTSTNWRPGRYYPSETRNATSNSQHTITGLTLGEIYAVQLMYETSAGNKVFAARDSYVWPSTGFQAHNKRVATYPFFGHFTNKTYTYRICTDTFPPNTQSEWASLIEDALGQWQTATGNMIRMNRDTRACTDLSSMSIREALLSDEDDSLSEIRMLDVSGSPIRFNEMLSDPFKLCILGAPACVTSRSGYARLTREASYPLRSADITLNHNFLANVPHLEIPTDIKFNACKSVSDSIMDDDSRNSEFYAYALMVHESGHALGLSDWSATEILRDEYQKLPWWIREVLGSAIPLVASLFLAVPERVYEVSHPTIPDSVLNYDSEAEVQEPDCSPHPFDVMAIHALYQSVP